MGVGRMVDGEEGEWKRLMSEVLGDIGQEGLGGRVRHSAFRIQGDVLAG